MSRNSVTLITRLLMILKFLQCMTPSSTHICSANMMPSQLQLS